MSKTFTAPFPQSPKTNVAIITAATPLTGGGSVATDNPTGTALLAKAGVDGALVTRITAMPRGTVTATSLQLYLRKSADPEARRVLIDSVVMPAQTVNATAAIVMTYFTNYSEGTPLRLEAGDELHVGSTVALAAGIVFKAELTDF